MKLRVRLLFYVGLLLIISVAAAGKVRGKKHSHEFYCGMVFYCTYHPAYATSHDISGAVNYKPGQPGIKRRSTAFTKGKYICRYEWKSPGILINFKLTEFLKFHESVVPNTLCFFYKNRDDPGIETFFPLHRENQ